MDSAQSLMAAAEPHRELHQQNGTSDQPQQPNGALNQQCCFLRLPDKVRLIIYDFLPLVTRHHSIAFDHDYGKYVLTVITKRLPGISILGTCKKIRDDAISVRGRAIVGQTSPIRIAVHWRAINSQAMCGILRCVANNDPCSSNNDFERVLYQISKASKNEDAGGHGNVANASSELMDDLELGTSAPHQCTSAEILLELDAQGPQILCSDITSHEQLHTLLRRNHSPGAPRVIEMAVLCPPSMKLPKLRTDCTHFYNWLKDMNLAWEGDSAVHIKLRPLPETEAEKTRLEVDYAFWDAKSPPSAYKARKWSYELGDWLEKEEWDAYWDAEEKVYA
ncbi:hypothetical protein T440DRAFT_138357 [Plenodomus tracheiphilus IPT5]|uniref:F-box domain-containing protein n=1 Tax=Plenodomus tracheiphilus IPT5 TaxID=1408161 RepID=A0A6A7B1W3_9PLEO|nr:hypothetical protein T440DRAFT_138357 [Plenodomus tracheiphilus IPT5]